MRLRRSLRENKLYIFGEDHHNKKEVLDIQKKIKEIEPDVVLLELMYEDEVWSREDAEEKIKNCKDGNTCDPRINLDLYQLARELNVPFIGIDIEVSKKEKTSLKESFLKREKYMVEMIKNYMICGTVVAVIGDTHLRTIKTAELGDVSLIQKEFSKNKNVEIIRSTTGEIK